MALLLEAFAGSGILDTSVFAYAGEDPIGMLLVTADEPSHATLAPGRVLDDAEKLNILPIGVRQAGCWTIRAVSKAITRAGVFAASKGRTGRLIKTLNSTFKG